MQHPQHHSPHAPHHSPQQQHSQHHQKMGYVTSPQTGKMYQIQKELGQGAFGKVFKGMVVEDGQGASNNVVALKCILITHPQLGQSAVQEVKLILTSINFYRCTNIHFRYLYIKKNLHLGAHRMQHTTPKYHSQQRSLLVSAIFMDRLRVLWRRNLGGKNEKEHSITGKQIPHPPPPPHTHTLYARLSLFLQSLPSVPVSPLFLSLPL